MTIKDVAKSVATYLNKTDLLEYLSDKSSSPSTDTLICVDVLTRLTNLVVNELSTTYVPLKEKEEIICVDKKFMIENLNKKALKILKVLDKNGNELFFKINGDSVITNSDIVEVEYSYLPDNIGLDEEIGFDESEVSLSVLSFGVCAEYCLTEWRFDEAVMWRERYSDGLRKFVIPKNATIKGRTWL